nr:MAG TPA: hypothetical protein [Caudoviricetes sp.]
MTCNETFECTVYCKYPLMTLPHTLEVKVNGYSFAVPFFIDIAVFKLNIVLQPQVSELTKFFKRKHHSSLVESTTINAFLHHIHMYEKVSKNPRETHFLCRLKVNQILKGFMHTRVQEATLIEQHLGSGSQCHWNILVFFEESPFGVMEVPDSFRKTQRRHDRKQYRTTKNASENRCLKMLKHTDLPLVYGCCDIVALS